jgi:Ca2+-dependent lipid-binding protein
VSDLAQPSDNKEYPYESVGIRSFEDPIQLDSSASKGTLHYIAEFLPAFALNNVKFKSRQNELQEATNESDDEVAVKETTPSIPQGITTRQPLDAEAEVASVMASNSDAASAHTANASVEDTEPVDQLAEMSREELLSQQSGVIVFNVLSGQLAKKGRIEVLLDDGYWPAFATAKSQSTNARWDHVGEGFIKELDMGQVWLRLDESSNDDKDDIVGEWKGPAKQFLLDTLVC